VGRIMAVFVRVLMSAVIRVIMGMAVPRAIRMNVVMLMVMLVVCMSTFNLHFTFAATASYTHWVSPFIFTQLPIL
jgi:hypothetical protein